MSILVELIRPVKVEIPETSRVSVVNVPYTVAPDPAVANFSTLS